MQWILMSLVDERLRKRMPTKTVTWSSIVQMPLATQWSETNRGASPEHLIVLGPFQLYTADKSLCLLYHVENTTTQLQVVAEVKEHDE